MIFIKSPVAELSHLAEEEQVEALGDLGAKQKLPAVENSCTD
jgi:hypothetical protein